MFAQIDSTDRRCYKYDSNETLSVNNGESVKIIFNHLRPNVSFSFVRNEGGSEIKQNVDK